jgi:thioester reductase-like protein
MAGRDGVFLTGATGFLGRYLLRELLRAGKRVAVLARDTRIADAGERLRELTEFANRTLGTRLPHPTVLCGDLREPGLGLTASDRAWLSRNCRCVIHAGANVSFRTTPDGDPRATNLDGTRRLLELCGTLGIREFHYVSTAFVCGERALTVLETDLDRGGSFHNDYERSKCEAEWLVRTHSGLRATVYRPSVIVGDSQTGYTSSYHGFYRFLELVDRLARPEGEPRKRRLPLRLPFCGDELRNLVPVDWVARAITRILGRPRFHGRTYHLTAPEPVPVREIKAVAERELGLDGLELTGRGLLAGPTRAERAFQKGVRDYWPYLADDPKFDRRHTQAAIPDLPVPRLDRATLARLICFAVEDNWGRPESGHPGSGHADCAAYIEGFFPEAIRTSFLARLPIAATLAFEIRGPGGGRWVCRFAGGRVLAVSRGPVERAEVTYRMDGATFAAVVSGRESPQAAFFARRIEMAGDVEKGLKLAVLFGRFVRESPYRPCDTEGHHAVIH